MHFSKEHSLSSEILRKMNPKEAGFFNQDRAARMKVKFRCGGVEFPPNIYYKIYADGSVYRSQYIHGKRHITVHDNTAAEACQQMGARVYYEQLVKDWSYLCHEGYRDSTSVVNLSDYMKYINTLDEIPIECGGRGNTWRRLNSKDLPRGSLFQDVLEFLNSPSHPISERLRQNLPTLQKRCPQNRAVLHRQAELLMHVVCSVPGHSSQKSREYLGIGDESQRRQTKSKQRAEKMKSVYMSALTTPKDTDNSVRTELEPQEFHLNTERIATDTAEVNDDWEDEASYLFQWSQQLTSRDVA